MSYDRPTLSALITRDRADLNARLPGADARLRHSVLDVLARMHAGAMNDLYGYANWISRQIHPDTADGDILARHAARRGIIRKAASYAAGVATATGTDGTAIPAETLLSRIDGTQYRVTTDAVVSAGSATLALEAVDAGSGHGMDAGQELTFVELIAGVAATVTVDAGGIADGADEENDDSLLYRLLLRLQTPPQGGSVADYKAWALAQPGVTRAWVIPGWMGAGTVGVTFVMDGRADIIPLAADVAAVQGALELLRPVTADLIVFAPIAEPVDISIALSPSTAAVEAAVALEIDDMFLRDGEPGGTIYRSRISEAASIAAGESHHVLSLPAADFTASSAAKLPVRGVLTFL